MGGVHSSDDITSKKKEILPFLISVKQSDPPPDGGYFFVPEDVFHKLREEIGFTPGAAEMLFYKMKSFTDPNLKDLMIMKRVHFENFISHHLRDRDSCQKKLFSSDKVDLTGLRSSRSTLFELCARPQMTRSASYLTWAEFYCLCILIDEKCPHDIFSASGALRVSLIFALYDKGLKGILDNRDLMRFLEDLQMITFESGRDNPDEKFFPLTQGALGLLEIMKKDRIDLVEFWELIATFRIKGTSRMFRVNLQLPYCPSSLLQEKENDESPKHTNEGKESVITPNRSSIGISSTQQLAAEGTTDSSSSSSSTANTFGQQRKTSTSGRKAVRDGRGPGTPAIPPDDHVFDLRKKTIPECNSLRTTPPPTVSSHVTNPPLASVPQQPQHKERSTSVSGGAMMGRVLTQLAAAASPGLSHKLLFQQDDDDNNNSVNSRSGFYLSSSSDDAIASKVSGDGKHQQEIQTLGDEFDRICRKREKQKSNAASDPLSTGESYRLTSEANGNITTTTTRQVVTTEFTGSYVPCMMVPRQGPLTRGIDNSYNNNTDGGGAVEMILGDGDASSSAISNTTTNSNWGPFAPDSSFFKGGVVQQRMTKPQPRLPGIIEETVNPAVASCINNGESASPDIFIRGNATTDFLSSRVLLDQGLSHIEPTKNSNETSRWMSLGGMWEAFRKKNEIITTIPAEDLSSPCFIEDANDFSSERTKPFFPTSMSSIIGDSGLAAANGASDAERHQGYDDAVNYYNVYDDEGIGDDDDDKGVVGDSNTHAEQNKGAEEDSPRPLSPDHRVLRDLVGGLNISSADSVDITTCQAADASVAVYQDAIATGVSPSSGSCHKTPRGGSIAINFGSCASYASARSDDNCETDMSNRSKTSELVMDPARAPENASDEIHNTTTTNVGATTDHQVVSPCSVSAIPRRRMPSLFNRNNCGDQGRRKFGNVFNRLIPKKRERFQSEKGTQFDASPTESCKNIS